MSLTEERVRVIGIPYLMGCLPGRGDGNPGIERVS